MTLEDFEKELAESNQHQTLEKRDRSRSRSPHGDRNHHRRHHRHRHRSSRHDGDEEDHSRHRHKRSRHTERDQPREDISAREQLERIQPPAGSEAGEEEDEWVEKEQLAPPPTEEMLDSFIGHADKTQLQRDSWMEAPSALGVDFVQRRKGQSPPSQFVTATDVDYKLRAHQNELNPELRQSQDGALTGPAVEEDLASKPSQHEVKYAFGDVGSAWRLTKLKAVYRQAKESGRLIEDIAKERYGDLRAFDDAREEEIEMDRRAMYGQGYVGKEKPSGELFQERKLDMGVRRVTTPAETESGDEFEAAQGEVMKESPAPASTVVLDQTALNKLKAQMMKAKLRGGPEAVKLEAEYNDAMSIAAAAGRQSDVVVLNKMESRMLAGGRKGEVKAIDNKRGRERGLVEENEDMSIEDMVRHEKRTRGQYGGEGKAFAERIAKDAKFDNDLDYLDENATKLSKSAPKSEINLRNTAISDYQKMKHVLDTCPLCYHEDTNPPTPPQAPLISLATRSYLTIPTSPEITPYGLCASIVPIQHRVNLLECDDDEWEEIRNFMKSLTRFYHAQKPAMSVIFYENAAHEGRKRHASLEAVPLPRNLGATAPAFFREAILAADEEWTQHKKLIDTLAKANNGGLGKLAFRRSMVSVLPYFHVWFTIDGGFGHVVEDARRWPKGDLFARELLGGMLDVPVDVIKRQGRWRKGDAEMEGRVQKFKKGWEKWDWTGVLMEAQ